MTTELSSERMFERLREIYRSLTGSDLPEVKGEPIPSNWDPAQYVRGRWMELEALVQQLALPVAPIWAPRVDIIETEREFRFEFEVAGIDREEIAIGVESGRLIIEGRRRPEEIRGSNGYGYRWREIPIGMFRREVPLPSGSRVDQMNAKLDDGILKVRIPQARSAHSKERVEIH